jgi:hypothetical protein
LITDIEKHRQKFKTWFDGKDFLLTMLFRGSEQNFSNANFTKLVVNQGPTLHMIKSEHDNVFGGCAFEKYPSKGDV